MIFELHLFKADPSRSFSNDRMDFYLRSSDEVCSILQKLSSGICVQLVVRDFDSVDSVFKLVEKFNK